MSNPYVVSTYPVGGDTDVVLGASVTITFDQLMDTTTLSASTFVLSAPNESSIITPDQLIADSSDANPQVGQDFIRGTFSYTTNSLVQTVMIFTPAEPLRPGVLYTALLVGGDSLLATTVAKNVGGQPLNASYQWTFTGGTLNVTTPPVQNPIPLDGARINPDLIRVYPRKQVGIDPTAQAYIIEFPGPINPNSFDPQDVLIGLEAINEDLDVPVPDGVQANVEVAGNKLIVTFSGV